jgi:hypothetical protein
MGLRVSPCGRRGVGARRIQAGTERVARVVVDSFGRKRRDAATGADRRLSCSHVAGAAGAAGGAVERETFASDAGGSNGASSCKRKSGSCGREGSAGHSIAARAPATHLRELGREPAPAVALGGLVLVEHSLLVRLQAEPHLARDAQMKVRLDVCQRPTRAVEDQLDPLSIGRDLLAAVEVLQRVTDRLGRAVDEAKGEDARLRVEILWGGDFSLGSLGRG